jgi:hypothetical protein
LSFRVSGIDRRKKRTGEEGRRQKEKCTNTKQNEFRLCKRRKDFKRDEDKKE